MRIVTAVSSTEKLNLQYNIPFTYHGIPSTSTRSLRLFFGCANRITLWSD